MFRFCVTILAAAASTAVLAQDPYEPPLEPPPDWPAATNGILKVVQARGVLTSIYLSCVKSVIDPSITARAGENENGHDRA